MKISIRSLSVTASLLALATLTACVAPAPVYQTTHYPYQPVQPVAQGPYVEYGRVANIEVIRSQTAGTPTTGGGAIAGGLLGGVLGNQIGSGNGRTAATALGVVGGALLGNSVEANRSGPRAYESFRVSIQTDNGGYRAFDVPTPGDLRIGDRVRIDNGQISRF
ncbi:glycine zipper 2TM domain-containing protein [Variovorax sp. J22P240]|uniref:glycine zipper 2TM domain-containing protein n=1 Tax=unclassified Variovorax TaxID=663243 RepID=UPI00257707A5|nr:MULTISPECIES: glycine zipper 2TM domain-containing protein [unclassified Variovorax]MDL9998862.1 glycine zipper 2TM domain-containing protein [Variovorax sp. J22P240]MDM0050634.1 glycine zipper 2TM domain-containing protein [Variovorax sp. J22R115]